ncbi:unnamed protein product [Owenia fusiformis]|uniref:Uncharacterized protein n=1 Tax=Owenia fusiformis TaxID=6347 RepID=A0A8J1Y3D6_OWEFU|nr:unnamed protein product [Owenia fusiformis]
MMADSGDADEIPPSFDEATHTVDDALPPDDETPLSDEDTTPSADLPPSYSTLFKPEVDLNVDDQSTSICDVNPTIQSSPAPSRGDDAVTRSPPPTPVRSSSYEAVNRLGAVMLLQPLRDIQVDISPTPPVELTNLNERRTSKCSSTGGSTNSTVETRVTSTNALSAEGDSRGDSRGLDPRNREYCTDTTDEKKFGRCATCGTMFIDMFSSCRGCIVSRKPWQLGLVSAGILGAIFFLVMFPVSFIYVEYDKIALLRRKSTGEVYTDAVFYPGCYVLGPDLEFLHAPSTAHLVNGKITITTNNRLSVDVGFSFQHFLRPGEFGSLYQKLKLDYPQLFQTIAYSEIKNEAVKYSLTEYRLNRSMIEQAFHKVMRNRLSGDCCSDCCESSSCFGSNFCNRCNRNKSSCTHGYHTDVNYFQLGVVDVPNEINERYIELAKLEVEAGTELFKQQAAIERKVTAGLVQDILNEANEITANASAQAELIKSRAIASATQETSSVEFTSLRQMCSNLSMTREDQKMSLFFLHKLRQMDNLLKMPGFEEYQAYTQKNPFGL